MASENKTVWGASVGSETEPTILEKLSRSDKSRWLSREDNCQRQENDAFMQREATRDHGVQEEHRCKEATRPLSNSHEVQLCFLQSDSVRLLSVLTISSLSFYFLLWNISYIRNTAWKVDTELKMLIIPIPAYSLTRLITSTSKFKTPLCNAPSQSPLSLFWILSKLFPCYSSYTIIILITTM